MKAVRFFWTRDSASRHIEVAEAVGGQWFARSFSGRDGWTRWTPWTPSWEGTLLFWGFHQLSEAEGPFRVRLPKVEVV